MHVEASATGTDLAEYAGGELAGELGELFGRLGSGLVPGSTAVIPVALDSTLTSDAGRAHAEALAGALADRL